jgi:peptide/nickel transport system permease protein
VHTERGRLVFAYVTRRVLTTIPLLIVGTFIIYTFTALSSDPLAALRTCQNCGPEAFERIIDEYDLDQPIPVRYVNWIVNAAQGDMGPARSVGNQPTFEVVMERAGNTARLALPAFVIIATLAVALGVFSAVRQYSKLDYAVTGFSFLGISLPTFVFGLLLQALAIWLLRNTGMRPFYTQGIRTAAEHGWLDVIRSHTLPILTLVLVITASESRFQRASMLEVINSDYIRTARAKGLPPRTVIFKHGLRNAMIPLVTIWAIDFAALLGGSVVTESIFSWPGLGPLLIRAISLQDLNLTMGVIMFTGILVVMFNLFADLLYGVLDPRIRYE